MFLILRNVAYITWATWLGMSMLSCMKLRECFAHNVIAARKSVGLSQENLAKAAGVSRAHIGRVENQRHAVNIDTVEKIAVALNVSPADLFRPVGE